MPGGNTGYEGQKQVKGTSLWVTREGRGMALSVYVNNLHRKVAWVWEVISNKMVFLQRSEGSEGLSHADA